MCQRTCWLLWIWVGIAVSEIWSWITTNWLVLGLTRGVAYRSWDWLIIKSGSLALGAIAVWGMPIWGVGIFWSVTKLFFLLPRYDPLIGKNLTNPHLADTNAIFVECDIRKKNVTVMSLRNFDHQTLSFSLSPPSRIFGILILKYPNTLTRHTVKGFCFISQP